MRSLPAFVAVACALFLTAADNPHTNDLHTSDLLWQHRNLGKAFFENPDTHLKAVTELREALRLKPDSVRERVNYGLALLHAGQTEAGVAELVRAQKQDPTLPHTWFNLGIAYKHAGNYDKAIEQFKGMIRLRPSEPVPHYNLGAVLRSQGDTAAALPEFLEAERLNPDLAGPHFQLFSLYQRAGDKEAAARERKAFEDAKKRSEGAAVPEDMEWCFYAELYDPPEPRPSAAKQAARYQDKVVSSGASGILAVDPDGSGHIDLLIWSPNSVRFLNYKAGGLDNLRDVRSVAAGDFDNDGLADLCVVTASGSTLFRNNKGAFTKVADFPSATKALWLDFDHDNDPDLLLFGPKPALMRNNGNGTFEDRTQAFPFVKGHPLDAVATAIRGDTAARDVVVSYADRSGVLYRDQLNGVFKATDIPALTAGATELSAQDFNRDGLLDLVSYGPQRLALRNHDEAFVREANADVAQSPVRGDFNGDRREDFARLAADGSVHLSLNTSNAGTWMTVRIQGVKNLKTAAGATVEMKSGPYYEKRIYDGTPLAFALDGRADADSVRITWPNGLIQNEPHQKPAAILIPEAQRLSGSCPMIFTWNGKKFQFITDVLGVAPLGASSGDGHYFPVDHDEYIQIPGAALKPVDGRYRIHITEELHEVSYLDKVQLIALDHPASTSIYTNDKFKSPPYPEFRLFGATEKIHPLSMPISSFSRNAAGIAELHTVDLDFGKAAADNHAALVLHGWVDWADGSTFLGASQSGKGLIFPYLQVKNAAGEWQTVVEDMGIPSGKPKTIVVDLTGKFLSASRQVRIVTNLCVYWDDIFLIPDAGAPRTRLTALNAESADVHFRGFSRPVIDPARRQPEQFLYDDVRPLSNWNPTRGMYTRYGDVTPLVIAPDDRMVIMGSGDELALEFPARSLPALPEGWSRDFLLLVDGWAKDADANTAFSQSVLPLPFHGMSAYPYRKDEHFPNDPEHQRYVRDYLTRPALRLIRPLVPPTE